MTKTKREGAGFPLVLRFASWALGLLALASAFVPPSPELSRALAWALCLFSVLGAGIAIGEQRKGAFIAYAAVAVLMNPFVPFHFQVQVWRLLDAAAGIWLIADHLAGVL